MHIRLLAVGERQPAWVDEAFKTYAHRLPPEWRFELKVLSTAARSKKGSAADAVEREGDAILAAVRPGERLVALDERGTQYSTVTLADRLGRWLSGGQDLCLAIGGPDGLSGACLARADERWSLSALTLPHGLARVLTVEQLYRAWSLRAGHPYHRA